MGHNQKSANRLAWMQENRQRTKDNKAAIAKLAKDYKLNQEKRDRELLDLESRLLKSIGTVLELSTSTAEALDLHLRPWYRTALDWTRNVIRKAPSSSEALPELVDIDFDDEETDPAVVVPFSDDVELDDQAPEPFSTLQNQRIIAAELAAAAAEEDDQAEPDIGQEDDGRAEGEPGTSDAISTPAEYIKESIQAEEDKKGILERLHDPEAIIKRLELRRDTEKGIVEDFMENQSLDQEERAAGIDQAITRMEEFELRIAHQKLILAGIEEAPE